MSKYTCSLVDWLAAGYTLPAAFSQIDDFDDLFTGYYAASEIGYETPELFEIKLGVKADLIIPLYAARISAYNSVLSTLGTNNKEISTTFNSETSGTSSTENSGTDTVTNSGTDTVTNSGEDTTEHEGEATAGAQERTHTELPIDSLTATPSSKDNAAEFTNSDTSTDTVTHGLQVQTLHGLQTATLHGLTVEGETSGTVENTTTQTFTGRDIQEQLELVKYYEGKILNLKQACLDEFKPLFMAIY